MYDNLATTALGEELITFGESESLPLTEEEITFFTYSDPTLRHSLGVYDPAPQFKVQLDPKRPDNRWVYDDRCMSTDGLMYMEMGMGANSFVFYFWEHMNSSTFSVYAE